MVYTLKVFVKHEGWNSFGEGNCIMVPILIVQPPNQVAFALPKVQSPPQWDPVVAHEINFGEHKEKVGTHYYETFVLPEQKKWKNPSAPLNLTAEQSAKEDQDHE